MGDVVFDDTQWPILIIRSSGTFSDEEYRHFAEVQRHFYARCQRFALIHMPSHKARPTAKQRAIMAEAKAQFKHRTERWVVAHAYVVSNFLVRQTLTAVQWITKPVVPTRVFPTEDQALKWVQERLIADTARAA